MQDGHIPDEIGRDAAASAYVVTTNPLASAVPVLVLPSSLLGRLRAASLAVDKGDASVRARRRARCSSPILRLLPVCVDAGFNFSRGEAGAIAQISMLFILSLYSVPALIDAGLGIEFFATSSCSTAAGITQTSMLSPFLLAALLAVGLPATSRFNTGCLVFPAAALGVGFFVDLAINDAPACIKIAAQRPVALLGILRMLAAAVNAGALCIVAAAHARAVANGGARWCSGGEDPPQRLLLPAGNAADAVAENRGEEWHSREQGAPKSASPAMRVLAVALSRARDAASTIPTAHVLAVALSATALLWLALKVVAGLEFLRDNFTILATADGPGLLPPDVFKIGIPVLNFAPALVYVVLTAMLVSLFASCAAVADHRRIFLESHAAAMRLRNRDRAAVTGATKAEGDEAVAETPPLAAPRFNLHAFRYDSASQYVASVIMTNSLLFLFIIFFLTTTVLSLIVVLFYIGFDKVGKFFAVLGPAVIATFILTNYGRYIPPLLSEFLRMSEIALVAAGCGSAQKVCAPLRTLAFWANCSPTDGAHVFSPRMLLCCCCMSAPFGILAGCGSACTRVVLGCACGALRSAVIHKPVVPHAIAFVDSVYMAYGGMMRLAHAKELDEEVAESDKV